MLPAAAADTADCCCCLCRLAAGYWAFSNASDKLGIKKSVKKKSKKGDTAAFDEDDWVKGTPYDVDKRKKAAAATKVVKAQ